MFTIKAYTIKQYTFIEKFKSRADYELSMETLAVDPSIVKVSGYHNGVLERTISNSRAVPRTKSSPVEKGHIN